MITRKDLDKIYENGWKQAGDTTQDFYEGAIEYLLNIINTKQENK